MLPTDLGAFYDQQQVLPNPEPALAAHFQFQYMSDSYLLARACPIRLCFALSELEGNAS
jgi:hypothetical protein